MHGAFAENLPLKELCQITTQLIDDDYELVHNSTIITQNDKQEHEKRNCRAKIAFEKRQTKITFIGTMKSGKSTFINACVGNQILPHRQEAMTTLSATISHKPFTVPTMIIPDTLHDVITHTLAKFKALKGKPNLPEHLVKFLDDLENIGYAIAPDVSGTQEINKNLLVLNDLIRMCFDLTVRKEISEGLCDSILLTLKELSSFPQIFSCFSASEVIDTPGLVTLIDTPGQDEIKLSNILRKNNETVLAESDAICVIVNATSLGNEAEAEIFRLVPQINPSKLYVVINKADSPNKRDQLVQQFNTIMNEFNSKLTQPLIIPKDHIFPLSALRASLLMTLTSYKAEKGEVLPPTDDAKWQDFYEATWGPLWDEMYEGSTFESLETNCKKIYANSGIQAFLQGVIVSALKNASVRCVLDVLNTLLRSLAILKKRIQNQISLVVISSDLKRVATIRDKLQAAKARMDELQAEGRQLQADAVQEQLQSWTRNSEVLLRDFLNVIDGKPVSWLQWWFTTPQLLFGTKKIVGQTRDEVVGIVQPTLDDLKNKITDALDQNVTRFVEQTYFFKMKELGNNFNNRIASRTQQVINELKQFQLHFVYPKQFELPKNVNLGISADIATPTSHTSTITIEKRAWWWFLTLVPWTETHEEQTFEIEPSHLRDLLKAELKIASRQTDTNVIDSVSKTINTLFDPYFDSVHQAIDDVSSDLDEAQKLVHEQEAKIEKYKEEANVVLKSIDALMNQVDEARKHPALSNV